MFIKPCYRDFRLYMPIFTLCRYTKIHHRKRVVEILECIYAYIYTM